MITAILRDLRFALRMLRKYPGHTAAAVVALALGIGLTTAMFSIVDGTILRGLPFPGSDRLLYLETSNPSRDQTGLDVDGNDFLDWRQRQHSFSSLAAFDMSTFTLAGGERPERYEGAFLSADALDLLGVRPALGRGFLPGEDSPQAEPVAILGDRVWRDRFGADPAVLGRAIRVNGRPATIVGVMDPEFRFPFDQEVWVPLALAPRPPERGGKWGTMEVIGRLRDGVSIAQAQAEMATITGALAREYPATNAGLQAVVFPYTEKFFDARLRSSLWTMLGAVGLVLLIACINVASLIMARAGERTRELAIRAALGAQRGRVAAQILIESLVLSAAGALLGLGVALVGIDRFNAILVERTPPFWIHIAVDPRALVFALVATVLAGLASGLLPALQASRTDVNEVLKDEGRSTSLRLGWFNQGVVVAELALSCALLVGAGLMIKSVVRVQTVDLGFSSKNLLTWKVPLFEARFPQIADRIAFFAEVKRRLEARPGVVSVAALSSLPTNGADTTSYALAGRAYPSDADLPLTHSVVAAPGLFRTFEAKVLAGRDFDDGDRATTQPVAIVNESFARAAWPREDALGKRLRLGTSTSGEAWRTVVGVVPDQRLDGFRDRKPAGVYVPLAQSDGPYRLCFALRAKGDSLAVAAAARETVAAMDQDTPIYFVKSMDRVLADNRFFNNLLGGLFGIFGAAALLLAAVGIYGVIAFSVERRTQEIGLRMALGAQRGDVLSMLLRQGARQVSLGLLLGLPAAAALAQLVSRQLFDVAPRDPEVFAIVTVLLAAVAFVACLLPGRRATAVDPIIAIRYD